jgi:DNA repair protein RadA/Sms
VEEPGTDLGVALAVASSYLNRAFPDDTVAFGEVGLKGEIRPVARGRARLGEAAKLGFRRALVPPGTEALSGIRATEVERVADALEWLEA